MIPIFTVDFDGVIHSYTSGWEGAKIISDPPVVDISTGKTAIEWLTELIYNEKRNFDIAIFSSRSTQYGGIEAMKKWLLKHGMSKPVLKQIQFPTEKPPSKMMLDDRAQYFNGNYPTVHQICNFKSYNEVNSSRYKTIDWIVSYVMNNSRGSLNLIELRRTLMNAAPYNYYFLKTVDPNYLIIEDYGIIRRDNYDVKDDPIVIDNKGYVIDGRHRAVKAIKEHRNIKAYAPLMSKHLNLKKEKNMAFKITAAERQMILSSRKQTISRSKDLNYFRKLFKQPFSYAGMREIAGKVTDECLNKPTSHAFISIVVMDMMNYIKGGLSSLSTVEKRNARMLLNHFSDISAYIQNMKESFKTINLLLDK